MVPEFEPDLDSDVSWLAFRYVSGEMGRDEAEAFEGRLDQDQGAREAVAEAVALAAAVAQVEPAVLRMTRRRVARVMAVLAVGAAAAASLVWLITGVRGP